MQVISTIAEFRLARARFPRLGFVPTMGFLHEGHLSLVRSAKAACGAVALSIFVNPTQFAPHEDLERYPRDEARDLALLAAEGVDLVLLPKVEEIYPPGFCATIDLGPVTRVLEGAARPVHFAGVATVVSKLFNIVQPDMAFFGQKDAQQCVVIRRLVRDFNSPVQIVIGPTMREADGLALSSRNAYLKPDQRAAAPVLNAALTAAKARFEAGERDAETLRRLVRDLISAEPLAEIDYVSLADPESLEELQKIEGAGLLSLVVRFGATRLLDNVVLGAA